MPVILLLKIASSAPILALLVGLHRTQAMLLLVLDALRPVFHPPDRLAAWVAVTVATGNGARHPSRS